MVTEVPTRLPGLGLPPVFLAYRQTSWVELEAGSDLHARLFHARQDLPGATLLERVLANEVVESRPDGLQPEVVATFPQGQGWPRAPGPERHHRRVRRTAALVVLLAGFLSLLSALAEPLRDRLDFVNQLFPMAVPETAAALAALGAVGLIVLARGIRRGQRRAWLVCLAILIAVAVLHLVKGVDVEEAIVALAAASYLWLHRESFHAKTDVARLGRGLLSVAGAAVLTVLAGTLAVELDTWIDATRHPTVDRRLPWPRALQAAVERMVGITHVALPHRLNEFFSPAMATAAAGLALALVVVLFRPVVQHRRADARVAAKSVGESPAAGACGPGAGGQVVPLAVNSQPFDQGWRGPARWWPGTGRAPSTTSPCGPTSSSSSGGTPSWPMPSTAGSAWFRRIPWDRSPSGRRPGGPSGAMSTSTAGPSAASVWAKTGCPSIGPPGCTTSTWATRGWSGWSTSPWRGVGSRGCARPSTGWPSTATASPFTTPRGSTRSCDGNCRM